MARLARNAAVLAVVAVGAFFTAAAFAQQCTGLCFGGPGDDVMHGSPQFDAIEGQGGDDQIYGYGNFDQLRGGQGTDVVEGGTGEDEVSGETAGTLCAARKPMTSQARSTKAAFAAVRVMTR